jgi:hypothetical protein
VPPENARLTAPELELKKLQLQAEILGRTERLRKAQSGSNQNPDSIVESPTTPKFLPERAQEILARPHNIERAKKEAEDWKKRHEKRKAVAR